MIAGSCRRGTTEITLHCILKCVLILQATDDLGELSTWDDRDNVLLYFKVCIDITAIDDRGELSTWDDGDIASLYLKVCIIITGYR